jgi:hypothetical protein
MTALTLHTSPRRTPLLRPTALERSLLRTASALEALVIVRMQRRAAASDPTVRTTKARGAAADRRRDAAAAAQTGMLPR